MTALQIALQIENATIEAIEERREFYSIHFGGDESQDMVCMPGAGWYWF